MVNAPLLFCEFHLDFDCQCKTAARVSMLKKSHGTRSVPCYRHGLEHRRDEDCPRCKEENE